MDTNEPENLAPGDCPSRPATDRIVTFGPWATEADTETHLAEFLVATGLFDVYRQVRGRCLWGKYFQVHRDVRADLLLFPSQKLIKAGWSHGAIVMEVKKPGEKLGPALNQLLDYLNSAWEIPQCGGVACVAGFGFVFQADSQGGPIGSIMAQQHVGTAAFNFKGQLVLRCGGCRVMTVGPGDTTRLGKLDFGFSMGSR